LLCIQQYRLDESRRPDSATPKDPTYLRLARADRISDLRLGDAVGPADFTSAKDAGLKVETRHA
jgi:hypothetical protein